MLSYALTIRITNFRSRNSTQKATTKLATWQSSCYIELRWSYQFATPSLAVVRQ